jgi:hypothetical protein
MLTYELRHGCRFQGRPCLPLVVKLHAAHG